MSKINVYWACIEPEWMRAEAPVPVLKNFLNKNSFDESGVVKCPAFKDEFENLFGIKSIYEYEFFLKNNEILSGLYDQAFFNRHVIVRSIEERVFSFSQEFVFFTDEKSLLMSGDLHPFLENNNISERCIIFPGKFDIGRWYRPLEFGFKLKEQYDSFKIDQGEIFQYVRFHTDKQINFIQFKETPELNALLKTVIATRTNKTVVSKLNYYYNRFNLKKFIMKEIKENIL